jgi:hypothetical protein
VTGAVPVSKALRERLTRRVLLALSRFGPRVRRATVHLAEPANPLGGVDQGCRIRAWLQDSDPVEAEAMNGGFEEAVGRAAAQLANRVGSVVDGNGHPVARPRPAGRRSRPLRPRRRGRLH